MDGISTNEQPTSSNQLSEENWKKLQKYYAENTGSLLEQLHLSEITGHKGTYKDTHLQLKQQPHLTRPHMDTTDQKLETNTENGQKPVVDETVLKDIGSRRQPCCSEIDITKKLGMISEGVNAWQAIYDV